jgi:iron complex outermembrane receptor protein
MIAIRLIFVLYICVLPARVGGPFPRLSASSYTHNTDARQGVGSASMPAIRAVDAPRFESFRPSSRVAGALACVLICSIPGLARAVPAPADFLKQLSLEELMNVRVTTASRTSEPLFAAPVAAYVITRDEILRSGVRSLPEALRLAPGVEVAREGTHGWSITIRGFNSDLSNKLLVLIDGRSVYSPLFAGVFWDAQNYLLEDVDRIEVVAGPGGTLWGANAVNGVINVITRPASASSDRFVRGGGGNEQLFADARFAGSPAQDWDGRAYLQYFERDPSRPSDGTPGYDDWDGYQAGFRTDRESGPDSYTIQGDAYGGRIGAFYNRDFTLGTLPGEPVQQRTDTDGQNLLGRWTRRGDRDSEMSLQAYLDRTNREIPQTYSEQRVTADLDFQHYFPAGSRHTLVWGAGLRYSEDSLDNSSFAAFTPRSRGDWTASAFIQDKIRLGERAYLTAGTKLEHNDYTGFEVQPNLRLALPLSERQTAWAAVSRAVRIPSRLDTDLSLTAPFSVPGLPLPLFVRVDGTDDFDSEEVWAYEAGWRMRFESRMSLDLAVFHNDYRDLMSQSSGAPFVVPGPPTYLVIPVTIVNGKDADSHGGTVVATWQPGDAWRLQFDYTYTDLDVRPQPGIDDPGARVVEGNTPRHQAALRAFIDVGPSLRLYGGLRYVDELPSQGVPEHVSFDTSLQWQPNEHLKVTLAGYDLLDPLHPEFDGGAILIERRWYAGLTWHY